MSTHVHARTTVLLATLALAICCRSALAADATRGNRIIVAVSPGTSYRVSLAATGLGGIAGAAQAENAKKHSEALNEKARELGVPGLGPIVAARLEKELEKKGYQIVHETRARPVADDANADADAEPEAPRADADMVLTVLLILPGFSAAHAAADYRPNIRALVKLRDRNSRAVLHSARVVYGQTRLPGTITVAADPKYAYASYETLMSRAGEAFEGLAKGAEPVAAAIAKEIPAPGALRR